MGVKVRKNSLQMQKNSLLKNGRIFVNRYRNAGFLRGMRYAYLKTSKGQPVKIPANSLYLGNLGVANCATGYLSARK